MFGLLGDGSRRVRRRGCLRGTNRADRWCVRLFLLAVVLADEWVK